MDRLARRAASGAEHGLTRRELEVLRHVAAGRSNKAIARPGAEQPDRGSPPQQHLRQARRVFPLGCNRLCHRNRLSEIQWVKPPTMWSPRSGLFVRCRRHVSAVGLPPGPSGPHSQRRPDMPKVSRNTASHSVQLEGLDVRLEHLEGGYSVCFESTRRTRTSARCSAACLMTAARCRAGAMWSRAKWVSSFPTARRCSKLVTPTTCHRVMFRCIRGGRDRGVQSDRRAGEDNEGRDVQLAVDRSHVMNQRRVDDLPQEIRQLDDAPCFA